MGLNDTVGAERTRISFFGMRNAGKSSLVNALTGQKVSVVSEIAGTTTDPVNKSMEILPLGPVLITDTPGIDDEGMLGGKRVEAARRIMAKTDIAVLVIDACSGAGRHEEELIRLFRENDMPFVIVYTKADLLDSSAGSRLMQDHQESVLVSAETGQGIEELKEKLGRVLPDTETRRELLDGFVECGDTVVLVTPIDGSAPKGRLILPQQQVLRALLDKRCTAVVLQPSELRRALDMMNEPPSLVITDSQAFRDVADIVPRDIAMTSFSIIFAKYKGRLDMFLDGTGAIETLRDGDRVLISEGCTHHRQCDDIGTVKIPGLIRRYTGADPVFEFSSGGDFPEDTSKYSLIIHCGGCMISGAEMGYRMETAEKNGTCIVNYGIAIAMMNGILERVTTGR